MLLEGNTTIDSRDLLKTFFYDWLQHAKKYASTKKKNIIVIVDWWMPFIHEYLQCF
jgi:hypothetical protein